MSCVTRSDERPISKSGHKTIVKRNRPESLPVILEGYLIATGHELQDHRRTMQSNDLSAALYVLHALILVLSVIDIS